MLILKLERYITSPHIIVYCTFIWTILWWWIYKYNLQKPTTHKSFPSFRIYIRIYIRLVVLRLASTLIVPGHRTKLIGRFKQVRQDEIVSDDLGWRKTLKDKLYTLGMVCCCFYFRPFRSLNILWHNITWSILNLNINNQIYIFSTKNRFSTFQKK